MSVIPTLQAGVRQKIDSTNIVDTCAYILRHAVHNPGYTSEYIEHKLVSLRKINAAHDSDPSGMAPDFKAQLEAALLTATGHQIEVTVDYESNVGEPEKYTLSISLVDLTTNTPVIPYGKITADNQQLSIKFD